MKVYRVQTGADSYVWFDTKVGAEEATKYMQKRWSDMFKAIAVEEVEVPTKKKDFVEFLNNL